MALTNELKMLLVTRGCFGQVKEPSYCVRMLVIVKKPNEITELKATVIE